MTAVSGHRSGAGESFRTRPLVGLLLFVIAAQAPFLNQAFHMDDGIYLQLARNIQHNPWFPQDRPTYFEGLHVQDLASTEHPWPLTSYLMAISAHLAGGISELSQHLAFLIFPILLACSMYVLARRFTRHALLATLTHLMLPVVYVMSHTLMTDIPLLSLWVASIALFVVGVDSRKQSLVLLGAIAAALSACVSYSGLCLVPLLGFYAVLKRNRSAIRAIVIVPAAVFGFWLTANYFHYHRFTPDRLLGYYFVVQGVLNPAHLIKKSCFVILALGGVTVFPLSLFALGRKMPIAIGLVIGASTVLVTGISQYDLLQRIMFVVLFGAGFTAIITILRRLLLIGGGREGAADDLFLGIWLFGFLLFCSAIYMTGSARYLLPATPPLVLILCREAERILDERTLRWAGAANLALGGLLALLLAISDHQFAQIYRGFSSNLLREYSSKRGNLWFAGEWGLRFYLEQMGGQELGRRDPRPNPGDLLIVPSLASPYETLFSGTLSFESMILVAPSRVVFPISSVPPEAVLVYTIGMPYFDKSDGMDFSVRFHSKDGERVLTCGQLNPSDGRRWRTQELPLRDLAGKHGSLVFSAEVGGSGNADADWVAIARVRICQRSGQSEKTLYDFRRHLNEARIEPAPDTLYHTKDNLPVFPMTVWLEQEPAAVLCGRHDYRPALPIRLLDAHSHAGFWSAGWGLLPFSLDSNRSVLETISVYEIIRKIDAFGEHDPSWYPE